MRTVLIVFFCCVSIASAQRSGTYNKTNDTTLNMQQRNAGEMSFGAGAGQYGVSLAFGFRAYFVGMDIALTDLSSAQVLKNQLDYDPPHNDYTLRTLNTARYGITFNIYYPVTKRLFVFPALGFSATGTNTIPQSNATGWYYKTRSSSEELDLCYGGGVSYFLTSGRKGGNDVTFSLTYRTVFGLTANIGVVFL